MGSGSTHSFRIKKNELMELSEITLFNAEQIFTFHFFFQKFAALQKDDGVIDYNEFLTSLGATNNTFTRQLFTAFQRNSTETINFREFIKFFSKFQSNTNIKLQTELVFKLFSDRKTHLIEKDNMIMILMDSFENCNALKNYLNHDDITEIVNESFEGFYKTIEEKKKENFTALQISNCGLSEYGERAQVNNKCSLINNSQAPGSKLGCSDIISNAITEEDRGINFEMFTDIFYKNPSIVNWICINLDKLRSYSKTSESRSCCF